MDYFSILNLNKEPFSNSPDPEYFFQSQQHLWCLQKLELSFRLRRGLNVVIGDVGTGKTTLCRQLIRKFAADKEYETHLILDPHFSSPLEFLIAVAEMFEEVKTSPGADEGEIKEVIKQYIFRKGVDEKKTVILIIDEGQKIPPFCLEILREFLNYETNEYKLLQIVIFAQKEFENTLREHANFSDRINLYHVLKPLNFRDTRLMIRFRLKQSSGIEKAIPIFSYPALWAIYRATGGYPRRIINLCHQIILTMIIQNRTRAGWFLVRSCAKRSFSRSTKKLRWVTVTSIIGLIGLTFMVVGLASERLKVPLQWKPIGIKAADLQGEKDSFKVLKTQDRKLAESVKEQNTTVGSFPEPSIELSSEPGEVTAVGPQKASYLPVPAPVCVRTRTGRRQTGGISRAENRLPSELGKVGIRRKETLSWMSVKVYGVFNRKYRTFFMEANPQIDNPDNLGVGEIITFPAVPLKGNPLDIKVWWVKIREEERLEEAFVLLRAYPGNLPPIRLIPYWDSRDGLKFAVICWGYFFDKVSARKQLNKLPASIALEGEIFSSWDKETVFFGDPYLGRGK